MRLAVLKEGRADELRVAATPDTVRKLTALGLQVTVQQGAGRGAAITDEAFAEAGAAIAPDAAAALQGVGVVLAVQAPEPAERALLPPGCLLVCIAGAHAEPGLVAAMAAQRVDLVAMELLPRITRAQSMDVLSSQANLAGYRAVIEGAAAFERGFPMMMTAAGTVPPARVFVVGAGVAGLQAIATARRLGAIVSATDVRPAAKEEIRSLGATYVGVEDAETAAQTGAYATQMSDAFRARQAELMAATVAKNDLVICTALVMGRRAPVIVTEAMVASMRPGSVVVDLAAEAGGNCAATVPGELAITAGGVKVLGWRNWPARIAVAASALYARNLLTFLTTFWDKEAGAPRLPETDEIVRGVLLTRAGAVLHEQFQVARADAPSAPAPVTVAAATEVPVHVTPPPPAPPPPDAPPTDPAAVAASPTFAERGPGASERDQALSFVPAPDGPGPAAPLAAATLPAAPPAEVSTPAPVPAAPPSAPPDAPDHERPLASPPVPHPEAPPPHLPAAPPPPAVA